MKWLKSSKIQSIRQKVVSDGKYRDPARWRDLTAYWILGLCNNYGYVVMLSAAHDIIGRLSINDNVGSFILFFYGLGLLHKYDFIMKYVVYSQSTETPDHERPEEERICQIMSTGAILLADIIPSLIIKSLSSFLPFYIK